MTLNILAPSKRQDLCGLRWAILKRWFSISASNITHIFSILCLTLISFCRRLQIIESQLHLGTATGSIDALLGNRVIYSRCFGGDEGRHLPWLLGAWHILVKPFPSINLLFLVEVEADNTEDAHHDSKPEEPCEDPGGTRGEAAFWVIYVFCKKMMKISGKEKMETILRMEREKKRHWKLFTYSIYYSVQ